MTKRTDTILYIVMLVLAGLMLFFFCNSALALDVNEAQNYVGRFCYVQYYKFADSDIEMYNRVIGKVMDIIFEDGYKLVILDYKSDLYLIKIDKVKQIKILRG